MRPTATLLACLAMASIPAFAAQAAIPTKPDTRTAAAVEAADDAWGVAEEKGDSAYIDWLLLPGYRSVGAGGKSTTKATIVEHAKSPQAPGTRAAKVAAWKADHPSGPEVTIYGDTAVLTWVSTRPEAKGTVYSCDIFVYRKGHWHGIYSQHTTAS